MSSAAIDAAAFAVHARDWRLRQAQGRAARACAPRRDLGGWDTVDHARDAACAGVLTRSHARTGDPVAIAADIEEGRAVGDAAGGFANRYADQTGRDHRQPVGRHRLRAAAQHLRVVT